MVEKVPEMFREYRPGYNEVMEIAIQMGSEYASTVAIQAAINELYATHRREHVANAKEKGISAKDAKSSDEWKGIYPYKFVEYRDVSGKMVNPKDAKASNAKIWVWRQVEPSMPSGKQSESTKDPNSPNYRFYRPIHKITGKLCKHPKRGWSFPQHPHDGRASFSSYVADHRIDFGVNDSNIPQQKYFLHEVETVVATSVIRQYSDGEPQLESEFGKKG